MTEDTNWLKKNPRMSLWRSSRFFGQDMDASLMANEQKSKNDVLVVSHMPRRSNIPMEKIKQMDFKFPAPVTKKSAVKKPVSRVSKFVVPQVVVSRPSMNPRAGENKTGTQRQSIINPNGRPSMFNKPGPTSANSKNGSSSNSKAVQRTPLVAGKCNPYTVKSSADLSLLSQSKVVNQSTPNEPAVLRSILKQRRNSGMAIARNLLDGKKLIAKRVNFNGSLAQEKENTETEEVTAAGSSSEPEKNELKMESDEESTVAFSKSFKPLSDEEEVGSKNGSEEKKESVMDTVNKSEIESVQVQDIDKVENNENGEAFSREFVRGLVDLWTAYRNKINNIRSELLIIDENFLNTWQLIKNKQIDEKLTKYEEEKSKLYEKLRDLEMEFRENVKSHTDIKTLFVSYMERKKNIISAQSELDGNFEKALRTIIEKRMDDETEDIKENVEVSPETRKTVKRVSGARRSSVCKSGVKRRSTPRKRNSREVNGGTPDNTPARRKKLSRKIEKQIRNLFENDK